jgi:hypothetical protein
MYDIIGDIHGYYDKLAAMLRQMGYRETGGVWRHAGRQAVFVGDLIDRGPQQLATVTAVRRMVDAGSGLCLQGNHEFNAVAWAMPDPEQPGEYLRPHSKSKNRAQHQAFLAQVGENSPRHAELIAWFRTLPLWLDLGEIRVVHACWDAPSMRWLTPRLGLGNTLTEMLYHDGSRRGHPAYEAIEKICKGIEIPLPAGVSFTDKDGAVRKEARLRWWLPELTTFAQAVVGEGFEMGKGMDSEIPAALCPAPYIGPPVFFGHYWMTGQPQIFADKLACLDYSVAKGGPLVAYRWDGETRLSADRFVTTG